MTAQFAEAFVLSREVEEQMLARLDVVALKPERILVIGCGIDSTVQLLQSRYPLAQIVQQDHLSSMLNQGKWIVDKHELDLDTDQIDLIVSNLFLPRCVNLAKLFLEWRRVLRPDGLLIFSSFGPDTLRELDHLLNTPDMHDLGDALINAGFEDPIVDVDWYTLTYKEEQKLLHEMHITGMIDKKPLIQLQKNAEDVFSLTFEVIYAHAWSPVVDKGFSADSDGFVKIPLSHLRRNRKLSES